MMWETGVKIPAQSAKLHEYPGMTDAVIFSLQFLLLFI